MKTSMRCLVALAFLAVPTAVLAASEADACVANAGASLAAVVGGDYAAAAKDFAPKLAAELSPAKIETAWNEAQQALGPYASHGSSHRQVFRGAPVAVASVTFSRASLDFVAACDASNRLTSFLLLVPSALKPSEHAPVKAHVDADGTRVEPLPVPSPLGPLRGALTLPAGNGPFPAVVLVAGSGPNDLDETTGGAKPFRDIADGLAKLGIASLRYDKRTFAHGAAMIGKQITVDDEVTDDALTALHLLARQARIDPRRVFLLGHSLGAMMAPRIAGRDPQLAGVIMLAAPARPLLDVVAQQERDLGARTHQGAAEIAKVEKTIAAQQALIANANPAHPPEGTYDGVPQSWWLSLHAYHQVVAAKSLSVPMLILQGGSDFQVSPNNDFDAWKQALAGKPDVTFHLYPGLSHLFTPAGRTLTTADYAAPSHVDPEVIADIAEWMKAQPASRR